MKEIWKDIVGYEGLYQVSNLGEIKRLPRIWNDNHHFLKEKILNQIDCFGYKRVMLYKNKKYKYYFVHRLVIETFKGKNNLQVDHIDGNKSNNSLLNLEYVTSKENVRRAWQKGLSRAFNVRKVNQYDLERNFIKQWDSVVDVLEYLNKSKKSGSISNCLSGRAKTAYGYIWEDCSKWSK